MARMPRQPTAKLSIGLCSAVRVALRSALGASNASKNARAPRMKIFMTVRIPHHIAASTISMGPRARTAPPSRKLNVPGVKLKPKSGKSPASATRPSTRAPASRLSVPPASATSPVTSAVSPNVTCPPKTAISPSTVPSTVADPPAMAISPRTLASCSTTSDPPIMAISPQKVSPLSIVMFCPNRATSSVRSHVSAQTGVAARVATIAKSPSNIQNVRFIASLLSFTPRPEQGKCVAQRVEA